MLPASTCGVNCGFDYPSVAVDASGRIIVGASAESPTGHSYYVVQVDKNGNALSGPTAINNITDGRVSRLVGTDYKFELFVPTIVGPFFTPNTVYRWEWTSGDLSSWTPNFVQSFGRPQNSSPERTVHSPVHATQYITHLSLMQRATPMAFG